MSEQIEKQKIDHHYRDWYRKKRLGLIKKFGGKCESKKCQETNPKKLQFAHKRRNNVTGRGRGSHRRLTDVIKHPKRYRLFCEKHHEKYDRENKTWCGQANSN